MAEDTLQSAAPLQGIAVDQHLGDGLLELCGAHPLTSRVASMRIA